MSLVGRTSARTRWPRFEASSVAWLPTSPVAPVMKIVFGDVGVHVSDAPTEKRQLEEPGPWYRRDHRNGKLTIALGTPACSVARLWIRRSCRHKTNLGVVLRSRARCRLDSWVPGRCASVRNAHD